MGNEEVKQTLMSGGSHLNDGLYVETETIDRLYLEMSQFTKATNWREIIMIRALEKLARLGNEPEYGNSIGNQIALDALQKIKRPSDV